MKGRAKRETGGANLAADDLATKNMKYTADSNVNREAEERKGGGRIKRKHGGEVHRSGCKCAKCEGGPVEGDKAEARADRKPRKAGGATGSPFSSAKGGSPPAGHKVQTVP